MDNLIIEILQGNKPDWTSILWEILEKGNIAVFEHQLLFLVSLILERYELTEEDKSTLLDLRNQMLRASLERTELYLIYPARPLEYNEGFFTADRESIMPAIHTHQNLHITDGNLLLTEFYFTGLNGEKYREIMFPETYMDPGFLLNNSLLVEREENFQKLSQDNSMFEL